MTHAPTIGDRVTVKGRGMTRPATVLEASEKAATVLYDEEWGGGTDTFTLRRSGAWVAQGFAQTYAPEMRCA